MTFQPHHSKPYHNERIKTCLLYWLRTICPIKGPFLHFHFNHPQATPSYKQLIPGSERPFRETYFFLHFSLRLSGNNHSWVISIAKFGPTTSDFGYDFWCKKAPLKHHCTVHWKRGLNANEYNCDTFPTKDTQFHLMDQLVNLGHPQNWARGAQNYPKNGPKWPQMLQNSSKNSFVGSDRSKQFKLPGKKLKLVWGHTARPVWTHGRGWVPSEWVLEGQKLAKNGSICFKMAQKVCP